MLQSESFAYFIGYRIQLPKHRTKEEQNFNKYLKSMWSKFKNIDEYDTGSQYLFFLSGRTTLG